MSPAGGEPFNAREFARTAIRSIEYSDVIADVLEDRVARIEECIAARWPRRWLLWARLRREVRGSAATFPGEYIARGDFLGRRFEWASQAASARYDRQLRLGGGQAGQDRPPGGDADPHAADEGNRR